MSDVNVISDALDKVSNEDHKLIHQIAKRAVRNFPDLDLLNTSMDLTVVHAASPLKLDDMLVGPRFDFMHDISGIYRHLNRDTGELENCFLPRFAA